MERATAADMRLNIAGESPGDVWRTLRTYRSEAGYANVPILERRRPRARSFYDLPALPALFSNSSNRSAGMAPGTRLPSVKKIVGVPLIFFDCP